MKLVGILAPNLQQLPHTKNILRIGSKHDYRNPGVRHCVRFRALLSGWLFLLLQGFCDFCVLLWGFLLSTFLLTVALRLHFRVCWDWTWAGRLAIIVTAELELLLLLLLLLPEVFLCCSAHL